MIGTTDSFHESKSPGGIIECRVSDTPGTPDTIGRPGEDTALPKCRRIRCPRCEWVPRANDRWCCGPQDWPEYYLGECGMEWHTFDTRGVCPGCGHRWKWTSCLRCEGWSLHEDWYEELPAS